MEGSLGWGCLRLYDREGSVVSIVIECWVWGEEDKWEGVGDEEEDGEEEDVRGERGEGNGDGDGDGDVGEDEGEDDVEGEDVVIEWIGCSVKNSEE